MLNFSKYRLMDLQKRFRFISALLLLSTMCFSLSSALHWFWHRSPERCQIIGCSCLLEHSGDTAAALQEVAHKHLGYAVHDYDCPVCAGALAFCEKSDSPVAVFGPQTSNCGGLLYTINAANADIRLPLLRAPPVNA